MYYIINQTSQVVAIDPELLSFLNIEDADTFYKKSALGELFIDLAEERVNITADGKIYSLNATTHPLSGILGEITLVTLSVSDTPASEAEEDIRLDLDEASTLKLLEEEEQPEHHAEEEISLDDIDLFEEKSGEKAEEQREEEAISLDDIDLFEEKTEEAPKSPETSGVPEPSETDEDDLSELILPTDAENAIAEIETPEESSEEPSETVEQTVEKPSSSSEEDNTPIYINIENISEKIGISIDDYNLFLNEYIDTALTLEEALQSHKEREKEEALNTLSHLSNVLHLPYVGDLLAQIQNAEPEDQTYAIAAFFSALGRLTTVRFEEEKISPAPEAAEKVAEPAAETAEEEREKRPAIDLSGVKPIHFDFQLEEAAKDLSLPVELIEEFVNDFIEQAHEETEKMLDAYEKGDLDTIQKIGHLLKGTSSNLRIIPLSDTLYEIQFNEELDRVPELIRHYWGHFLSLENQIKLISK